MRKIVIFVSCLSLLVLLSSKILLQKDQNEEIPLQVGKKYNGFIVTKSHEIAELQSHLTELTHEESGAKVLHLRAPDPENFFCIAFRTLPTSSNGVAHVLEHTTCEASKKFPEKSLFFSMMSRSMHTFMNAFTASEFTAYPAASKIEKDFYNLLDIYIASTFHPTLDFSSFSQEGHRLEFANPTDPSSPLEYKGIVYNEMKGQESSLIVRRLRAMDSALFPNSPYQFNSGGDPKEIPNLTHQELVNFYNDHYYAGNCLFFFYGDIPLKKHLDFIEEKALRGATKKPPVPPVPKQIRFSKKVTQELFYPASNVNEDQHFVSFGWLTTSVLNNREIIALHVLNNALMGNDASPLKLELLRSGLCKQVLSSLNESKTDVSYVIFLEGCKAENATPLETLITSFYKRLANEGISPQLIERSIHQLELQCSEIRQGSEPFGFTLFDRCLFTHQSGGNAEDALCTQKIFDDLRNELKTNPSFFQTLISTHFVNNDHFVQQIFKPSKTLAKDEFDREKEKLAKIKKGLSPEQTKNIIALSEQFRGSKEIKTEECSLPKITLEDVPKKPTFFGLSRQSFGNIDLFHHNAFTNHLTYIDLSFPLPEIEQKDLWMVQLFSMLLPKVGAGTRGYADNLEQIRECSGGIYSTLSLNHQAQDSLLIVPSLHIRSKALDRNVNKLFSTLFDIASSPNFMERERLKELIIMHANDLKTSIGQNPLEYAMNASFASTAGDGYLVNSWQGLEYVNKIVALAENFDKEADTFMKKLTALKEILLCNGRAHLVVTCDQATYNHLVASDFGGLARLPIRTYTPWKTSFPAQKQAPIAHLIDSNVAFNAMGFKTLHYTHPDSAAVAVAAQIFTNSVLLERIRKQGGAYGGRASYNPLTGKFAFVSYRDPHIASTVSAFEEAITTGLSGNFTESELEEAKLGVLKSLDSPVAPGNRGNEAHSALRAGNPKALRQIFRNNLFSLKREDIQRAIAQHIAPRFKESVLVTFAGKELIEKENSKLKIGLQIESR